MPLHSKRRSTVPLAVLTLACSTADLLRAEPEPTPAVELPAVTVTGDRFDRPRGQPAESHALLFGDSLDGEVAPDAFSLLDRAANTSTGFAQHTPFALRGIGNDSVSPGLFGRVAAVAAVYHDGVAVTPASLDYFAPTLWDVASVSVFRGPLATGYGVNALAGGLFIHYAEPVFAYEGHARAQLAEFDTREAAVMQNVPLAHGKAALRISAEHRESDGAARNVTLNTDDWARFEQDHLRAALRWEPLADDSLRLDFLLRHERTESATVAVTTAVQPGGSLLDNLADSDKPTYSPGTATYGTLTVRRDLSPDSTLRSITAAQKLDARDLFDLENGPFPVSAGTDSVAERTFSQELQFTHQAETLRLLFGGFAQLATRDENYNVDLAIPGFPANAKNQLEFKALTLAAFTQAEWTPHPAFTAEAGLRVHREQREAAYDNQLDGFGTPSSGERADTVLSPRLSLTLRPFTHTSVGALVSHGFRGGGVSSALLLPVTRTYGPETAWNYELFLRQAAFNGRLWLQANVFLMDWRDQQVSATLPGGVPILDDVLINAGRSRVHGFELESGFNLTPRWSIFASLGQAHTEFLEFNNSGTDYAGDPFPNAPEWSASVGGGYALTGTAPGPFGVTTLTYRSSTYSSAGQRDFTALEARTLLSARLGWRWRSGLSLYAYGENLLDDRYAYARIDRRLVGQTEPVGRAGQPRTLGVGADWAW
jgi:iron complex outermembrane receptor protein